MVDSNLQNQPDWRMFRLLGMNIFPVPNFKSYF